MSATAAEAPLAILGGGPVGLTLALLLARRGVRSVVFDARSVEQASDDRRLLALSLGSLQTIGAVTDLPRGAVTPIRTVIVSSVGQFGRAVIGKSDVAGEMLGATIRYGELIAALSAATASNDMISMRRPVRVLAVKQSPASVEIELDGHEPLIAPLALSAEGLGQAPVESASQSALLADVEVSGIDAGTACERFTRDGPLALLPLPARLSAGAHQKALVWCMDPAQADRRSALSDANFLAELRSQLGGRGLQVLAVGARKRYPLYQRARDDLVEHRIVYLGNAAQTLHPVAGQGLNLGLRDSVILADQIAAASAAEADPVKALHEYARSRRADRAAILALTRLTPSFFATRFAPIAAVRSIGLTALAVVPNLRREFARLLMFGVRF
ncbi:MAG: FAD-dependent monooxygenase [Pseudomonadota bacterium]|nr:FAD-dependent monooxygenase [Pseudomonadota bacterium]